METKLNLANAKKHVNTLKNTETFWDDVRAYLADKWYEDYQIKRLQAYCDKKWEEMTGEVEA